MANLIQIKRSTTTATPPSLANGELAYTANGDVLFVGSNSVVVPVGGKRFPGTLTANQALVANATGSIDEIRTANAVLTKIYANSSFGTAGQVLSSNGTGIYWAASGGGGSVTQVNTGNGLTGGPITSSGTIAVVANSGIVSNSTGVFVNANSGLLANTTGVFVQPGDGISVTSVVAVSGGNGLLVNASGVHVRANNGIVSNATGVYVNAGTGVTVNSTGVHIGQAVGTTDNVTFNNINVNGNTVIGSNSSDTISVPAQLSSNIIPNANATYYLGNNTLRFNEVHAVNVHSEYLYIDKDVQISGNLVVSGNVFSVNVSTLSVTDSLIHLASNNSVSDTLDIGFFGNYNDGGGVKYTGLFRDASTDSFKLFEALTPAPTTTVDTGNTSFTQARLEAFLTSGALFTNSSVVSVTANSTVNVNFIANSISLTTPLERSSGGTGLSSFTAEDILVANSTSGFRKLGLGTDGFVLQSNGTAVLYATLDGGTF